MEETARHMSHGVREIEKSKAEIWMKEFHDSPLSASAKPTASYKLL
jgi:hypothetical protein